MNGNEDRKVIKNGEFYPIKRENEISLYSLFEELERVMVEVNEYYQKLDELERMERKNRLNELISDERMKLQKLKVQFEIQDNGDMINVKQSAHTMHNDNMKELDNCSVAFADEDDAADDDSSDFVDDVKDEDFAVEDTDSDESLNQDKQKDVCSNTRQKHIVNLNTPNQPYNTECNICKKMFSNIRALQRHRKSQHSWLRKTFTCVDCDKSVCSKWKLQKHHLTHIVNTTHICDVCGLSFRTETILLIHVDKHKTDSFDVKPTLETSTIEDKYSCSKCSRFYAHEKNLEIHKMKIHGERRVNICKICFKIFSSETSLNVHVLSHSIKCQLCTESFRFKSCLQEHMQTVHNEREETPFWCSLCEIDLGDMNRFSQHAIEHLENQPCFCIICKKTFKHSSTLVSHINLHSGPRSYDCPECSKQFRKKIELSHHRNKMHNPDGVLPNQCKICKMSFDSRDLLKLHKQSHIGERPFKCTYCPKAYANTSDLKKHVTLHTGEKKYMCHTCGRQFRSSDLLRAHIVVHTGVKKYSCEECGKSFGHSGTLVKHRKSHQAFGTFQCEVCSKLFKTHPGLTRHLLIHTGLRPFPCDQCDKAFNQKGNLTTHYRIHSQAKPYKCPICYKAFMYSGLCNDHIKSHEKLPLDKI